MATVSPQLTHGWCRDRLGDAEATALTWSIPMEPAWQQRLGSFYECNRHGTTMLDSGGTEATELSASATSR